jgi:hypothetical protein
VKFIIMQFSPRSVFLPFRSKHPPQHSVHRNPRFLAFTYSGYRYDTMMTFFLPNRNSHDIRCSLILPVSDWNNFLLGK